MYICKANAILLSNQKKAMRIDYGSTHLLFFNFHSVPFQFNSIKWKLNRKGTGLDRERNRNGKGMDRDWNGNGTGMEQEWN